MIPFLALPLHVLKAKNDNDGFNIEKGSQCFKEKYPIDKMYCNMTFG